MLKIIPLGGLGEIGLNMILFETDNNLILIDAGLMFPEDYMLGVDIVIPDMEYLRQKEKKIIGILLTHAHEDHIGALPYLLKEIQVKNTKTPVYGTAFTLGIVSHKLDEHDQHANCRLIEIHPGTQLSLGGIGIEFFHVDHSIVGGVGIVLRTPLGVIIHTGDFKINDAAPMEARTDTGALQKLGDKGVLALLSDSTNVETKGRTISDQEVAENLEKIIAHAQGRIIVALFASNVARVQDIIGIAVKTGKKIVFTGRSVELTVKIAKELGYIQFDEAMEIKIKEIDFYPPDQIIIITTGSQGEPMSVLTRIAYGDHKQIQITNGDIVILSSRFIPGNEKAIANIINALFRRGADVHYSTISPVHVSGHALQDELKRMLELVRPRYFIPIHGEYRHLTHHKRLAIASGILTENVFLLENGDVLSLAKDRASIGDKVPSGRILIDGKGIGDVGRSVLKERRLLSEHGLVIINLVLDEETGIVTHGPEIISHGFIFGSETGHLVDDAQCIIIEIVEDVPFDEPDRVNLIRTNLQKELKKYFYFTIKRRPVILPIVLEL